MAPGRNQCEHGHLARKCPHCEINELEAEIEELRAALCDVRAALHLANDRPGGPISDTIWMTHTPETLFDFIDRALLGAGLTQLPEKPTPPPSRVLRENETPPRPKLPQLEHEPSLLEEIRFLLGLK